MFRTAGAERDLEAIYNVLLDAEGEDVADPVLTRLAGCGGASGRSAGAGRLRKELVALGIREYRQVYFKPHRLIYRLKENHVYVVVTVDDRRDLQSILSRRILSPG